MRNKFVIVICIGILYFVPKLNAKNDSTVLFSDLKFVNDFEKEVFIDISNNNIKDKVSLFLGIDSSADKQSLQNVNSKLNATIKKIVESADAKKGIDKTIEACFKQVHKEYLRKYELQNFFNKMFETGNYNCVSATALYSIVFDALKIPYDILETPTHVYLIAKGTKPTKVETTDPVYGYFTYNENFKNRYVTDLKKYKLISENEYNTNSTDDLFNKYYFNDSIINITQLGGIQYLNAGIYELGKENYESALINFEKAYYIYPSQKLSYLLLLTAAAVIADNKYDKLDDIEKFIKIIRYRSNTSFSKFLTNDELLGEFAKIANTNLVEYNRRELFDQMYEKLIPAIKDSSLLKEISFLYNYESSRTYYMQHKVAKAIEFAEKAYVLKQENLDAQTLLINTFVDKIKHIDDPQSSIDAVNAFSGKYPHLIENTSFKSIVCNAHLLSATLMYINNKVAEAEKHITWFEELHGDNKELIINKDIIVQAYSEAATYYFKRGNQSKAKAKISDGLKLYPESYKLKARYDMLK